MSCNRLLQKSRRKALRAIMRLSICVNLSYMVVNPVEAGTREADTKEAIIGQFRKKHIFQSLVRDLNRGCIA